MEYGYIRVGAAVPKLQVANCTYNTDEILQIVDEARSRHIKILVFPELSVTSYTCGDLFLQLPLLSSAEKELERLILHTKETDMLILIGLPVKADNQCFNCAVLLHKGSILGAVPKTFIPNYSEFYEARWFATAHNALSTEIALCGQKVPFGADLLFRSAENPELCIGVEICEDLWVPIPPSSFQSLHGASLILNPSASNEVVGKHEYRKALVQQQSARCMTGYVYAAAGVYESTTDVVFSGHSFICENGSVLSESVRFSPDTQLICSDVDIERLMSDRRKSSSFMGAMGSDTSMQRKYREVRFSLDTVTQAPLQRAIDPHPFVPADLSKRNYRCEEIFSIQTAGLSKRIVHTGAKAAVVGISGGLDSTLALLVCVKTYDQLGLDRKNIIGITMPGFGTTDRTYNNAITLMQSLGITIREISIAAACMQHFQDIGHDPALHDVTYENTQARERTQILMDVANKENGLVIGTGDLSELALGWATYNGDHMSMYAVNTSIPKTLVRYLVQWVSDHMVDPKSRETLRDILETPVSPELLPPDANGEIHQKTEELVGPYELHDFFLYYLVRFGFSPAKIALLAEKAFENVYSRDVILQWLKTFYRRFFTQQFKRSCLPDGPKVGSICLSPRGDWRMPSDASYQIWMDEIDGLMNTMKS